MMRTVFLLLVISLSGCKAIFGVTFHDRAQDYLDAETKDRMQPVEGQEDLPIQDLYIIPEVTMTTASALVLDEDGDFVVPGPKALILVDDEESMSLVESQGTAFRA